MPKRKRSVKARNRLVEKHLGLARSVVRYVRQRKRMTEHMTPAEILSEAYLGLIRAAEYFDHKLGKFSTYAWAVMVQQIVRAAQEERVIRVPHWTYSRVRKFLADDKPLSLTLRRSLLARTVARIADIPPSQEPVDKVMLAESDDALHAAIESLPDVMRTVVRCRYWGGMTQAETAAIIGLTKQRVSQIERAAIERLRQRMA